MTRTAHQDFVELLRERGVIPDKAPPPESPDRPWFVALLQGAAGWLAGLFLLSFIGLLFKPDSTVAIFLLGAILLAGAWTLYHADRDAVFLDQLALAVSIAGQFAVGWGIAKDHLSGLPIAATMLGLQLFVLVVMPNKTARTLAALFACIAWVFTVQFLMQPGTIDQQLFGEYRGRLPPLLGKWTVPIAWLITWVPLLTLAAGLIRNEVRWMSSGMRGLARPALMGVLLGLTLGGIAAFPAEHVFFGLEHPAQPFTWWALFPLLSVGLALAAAYGAFLVRSGGLLGAAVLAALLHLAHFYYLYGTTLMWKAAIMLATGVLLLLGGIALHKDKHEHEQRQGSA